MAEEQLKLFSLCNALRERFSSAFFRGLPVAAGVYLMCDAQDRVLYVGKAKNLRQRLASYQYAHERRSRKTSRLLARVASIRWQTCASEEEALLEENRLLRELRPRFNRVNTWPAARFVQLQESAQSLHLSLVFTPDGECYGAFKGASRENFGALLRLLWTIDRPYAALPRSLLLDRARAAYELPMCRARFPIDELRAFFRGDCGALAKRFKEPPVDESPFYRLFRETDALALEHFSRIGPARNHALRMQFGAGELIAPETLDDLIVRQRFVQRAVEDKANATEVSPVGVPKNDA